MARKPNLGKLLEWKLDSKGVERRLQKIAATADAKTKRAVARAAAWWQSKAQEFAPVRGSKGPGQYRRQGRGQLRKRITAYSKMENGQVRGGLLIGVSYAEYLVFGTSLIAGGKVKRWRHGDAAISAWPAKIQGEGGPKGLLPVALPWFWGARARIIDELSGTLLED